MSENRQVVTKLILVITLFNSFILALIVGYNYQQSKTILQRELETNAQYLASSLINRVNVTLSSIGKITEGLARALESGNLSQDGMQELLRRTVENNNEIFGAGISFEPYAYDRKIELFAPYYHRAPNGGQFLQLETVYEGLPYRAWDWYQMPLLSEKNEWSEPYYDEGAGNALMTTCSVPFFRIEDGRRTIRGVVTTDIAMSDLATQLNSVRILKTGYAVLLSRNGVVMSHPQSGRIMNEVMFKNDSEMRAIGKRMAAQETGFEVYSDKAGARSWIYFAPIQQAGWTIVVVFPEQELITNINQLSIHMTIIGLLGIALITAAVFVITRKIVSGAEASV